MERLCLQIKDLQGEWTNAIFDVRTGFISLSSVGGWFISRSERCVSGVLGPVPFGKEIALVHSPCKSLICNSLVAEAFPCKACPKEHSTLRQLGSCIEDVKGTVHSNLCCARHGKDLPSNAQVRGNGALVGTGKEYESGLCLSAIKKSKQRERGTRAKRGVEKKIHIKRG